MNPIENSGKDYEKKEEDKLVEINYKRRTIDIEDDSEF